MPSQYMQKTDGTPPVAAELPKDEEERRSKPSFCAMAPSAWRLVITCIMSWSSNSETVWKDECCGIPSVAHALR